MVSRIDEARIRSAWLGRVSGCQLGKPLEALTVLRGPGAPREYLREAGALPLRDYVPAVPGSVVEALFARCCRGRMTRAEPDDDLNYTVLSLLVLEERGADFTTEDVARAWFRHLPAGATFTAEREALARLATRAPEHFGFGEAAGFDVTECASQTYGEWIGAQIRTDLFGWVRPGRPRLAAEMARRDAALSHRGDGIEAAAFVAALAAAIPEAATFDAAAGAALETITPRSGAAAAVALGRSLAGDTDAPDKIAARYPDHPWAHACNNHALVVWGLLSGESDFARAVGDTVAAGFDTDCNGATVGGLWGLSGRPVPQRFTDPWQGRVAVTLAGIGELHVDDLVTRTCAVARRLAAA